MSINKIDPTDPNRWHVYYSQNITPWDSKSASSQLVHYLTSPCDQLPFPTSSSPISIATNLKSSKSVTTDKVHICSKCKSWKPPLKGRVLEFACGTASSIIYMAQLGYTVVGVELVDKPIQQAKQIAMDLNISDHFLLLQHDLFKLPEIFTVDVARQMLRLQSPTASSFPDSSNPPPSPPSFITSLKSTIFPSQNPDAQKFDFIYDCQCFHVLRRVDQDGLLYKYMTYLKPKTGLLMLLAGRTKVQTSTIPAGMPVLTEDELRACFEDKFWEIVFLVETVFDDTEYYLKNGKKMPAWWMLARGK